MKSKGRTKQLFDKLRVLNFAISLTLKQNLNGTKEKIFLCPKFSTGYRFNHPSQNATAISSLKNQSRTHFLLFKSKAHLLHACSLLILILEGLDSLSSLDFSLFLTPFCYFFMVARKQDFRYGILFVSPLQNFRAGVMRVFEFPRFGFSGNSFS